MSNDLPPLSGPVDASGEPADIMRAARARADRVDADYERLIAATVPSSPAQPTTTWTERAEDIASERENYGLDNYVVLIADALTEAFQCGVAFGGTKGAGREG